MVRAERRTGLSKWREKLVRQLFWPLLLAVGIFYFSFHALSGERGLYALLKEERKLEVINAELADVTAQRKKLEHDTRLLGAGSLDLDMLDEQSRALLGEAREDEIVIPLSPPADSRSGSRIAAPQQ